MKLTAACAAFRPSRAGLYLPLGRTCAKSGAAVTDSANAVRGSWGFVCVFKYLTTIIIRFQVGELLSGYLLMLENICADASSVTSVVSDSL